jgi:Peptidase family M23
MRSLITTTLLALAALVAFPPSAAASGWTWPVRGEVITPYRNGGDPYASGQHRGIDIAAPEGAAVGAATAGTVTFAGRAGHSGLTVNVRAAGGALDVSYLHLSSVTVARGEHVETGQRLGAVGTTGTRSTDAPHLHLGVREAGSRHAYRDPLDFLPPPGGPGSAPEPPALPVEVPLVPLAPPVPSEAPRAVPAPGERPVLEPGRAPDSRPAPAPGPLGAPVPAPLAAPLGEPAPASVGRGQSLRRRPHRAAGSPRSVPAGASRGRSPTPSLERSPRGSEARRVHTPLASRASDGAGAAAAGRDRSPAPPDPDRRRRAEPGRDRELDLAWLAACLGLVVVALALGRPAGSAVAARRARDTLSALARPLAGRG